MNGETAPVAITAHGGQYVLKDDRTIPDTMEVIFEFDSGSIALFGIYEASGGRALPSGEVELRGTRGTIAADLRGYQITPTGGGQFQSNDSPIEPMEKRLELPEDTTAGLVRNFLDCVKSREKCMCDLELGHRSTSFAHLANIALETGTRIEWDPQRETKSPTIKRRTNCFTIPIENRGHSDKLYEYWKKCITWSITTSIYKVNERIYGFVGCTFIICARSKQNGEIRGYFNADNN